MGAKTLRSGSRAMGDASRREPAGGAFVLSILTALSLALWAMGDAVAREHEARDSSYTARKAARAAAVQKPKAAARRAALDKAPGNKFAGFDPAGFPATANRSPAGSAAHHAILSHPAAMQAYERRRIEHRATLLAARSRLPQHPLPGERGFTGVPPVGEKRFVSSEMVFHVV